MKHTNIKSVLIPLLAIAVLATPFLPATAENSTDPYNAVFQENARDKVKIFMNENKIAGLSIALVDDQEVVWSQGFQDTNLKTQTEVTPDTLFRLGSLSKIFTATAVMRLVEAGKIDLDEPLQTYIPEFTIKSHFPLTNPITIRSLLTHHSGLPESILKGIWSYEPEYFTGIVPQLQEEYMAYPPNYIYAYSNIGISLLGVVIERVTGQSFTAYMEAEILKPMAMNHSSFILREDMKPFFAQSYLVDEESLQVTPFEEPPLRDLPTGGMYSSVHDLSNFLKTIFANGSYNDREILKKATLAQMLTPQNRQNPLDLGYQIGLAWQLYDPTGLLGPAGKVAWHNGGNISFHSSLITLPEHKLGIVILSNTNIVVKGSLDSLGAKILRLALEAKTGRKFPKATVMTMPERPMTKAELRPIEGTYASNLGLISIYPKDSTWVAGLENQEYQLRYHGNHWFSIPKLNSKVDSKNGAYFRFTRINGVPVMTVKSAASDFEIVCGEKVPLAPLTNLWKQRQGTYRITNDPLLSENGFKLTLEADGSFLRMTLLKLDEYQNMILVPMSPVQAVVRGLGRSKHQTVVFKTFNNKEYLYFLGLELEKE